MRRRADRFATLLILLALGCGGGQARRGPVAELDAGARSPDAAARVDAGEDAGTAEPPALTAGADYLITVRTATWTDTEGVLTRWQREGEAWVRDGEDVPIVLGREGLGWGRGLHGEGAVADLDGPEKREGDGRSPAGAFWLDHALGYAPEAPDGTRIGYREITPTLQCVEDVASAHYNRIVDRAIVAPDWEGDDLLRRDDGLYEFLVFVAQNTEPAPVAGRGSCILFHVWSAGRSPTAGCTSMARASLESIVRGLAPENNLLVQLPDPVYRALAADWDLPPVD